MRHKYADFSVFLDPKRLYLKISDTYFDKVSWDQENLKSQKLEMDHNECPRTHSFMNAAYADFSEFLDPKRL